MLRSLRHRNFRLFLLGQIISLTGTWMQQVALSWLAYRLTHSAFVLGVVGFASQLPSFFLAPWGGVIADRANRHHTVIVTQALSMLQALALWALVFTGHIGVPSLLLLTALLGCVNGVDIPVRQAFLIEMVGNKDDLANAIALNSSAFNAARLVGPALAGFLIQITGEAGAFLINGLSYVAVIGALFAMKLAGDVRADATRPAVWANLREGVGYAFGFTPIRSILLLLAVVSLAGVPFIVLMPIFAADVLHGGADTLGTLMSAVGLGALAGALMLAARKSVLGLGRVIFFSTLLLGGGLVAFSFATHVATAGLALFVAGFGMMAGMASSNTILQTIVDDDKRGRVMSLYAMAFMGTVPFGNLLGGWLASRIGAGLTVRAGGFVCIAGALLFLSVLPSIRAKVRPLYLRLGILPEAAAGLEDRPLEEAEGT